MTAPVGADVESLCAKCGDVWHVVVAKVGDKIAKVQCKQCHAFHRHKPPPGSAAAKKVSKPAAAAGAAPKTSATKAKPKSKKAAAPDAPTVQPDLSKPVRRYSAAESYTTGERITHPTFGQGIVEGSQGPGKVSVSFSSGRRVLAVAKAENSLGRPTNNAHQ